MKKLSILLVISAFTIILNIVQAQDKHPFLITKTEEFSALRERAAQEPWASMKKDVIEKSDAGLDSNAPVEVMYYLGEAGMAAILDSDRDKTHAARVRDVIVNKVANFSIDNTGWGGTVEQCGAIFTAVLALDIVYNFLSPADVASCEEAIQKVLNKVDRKGSWIAARMGAWGTWEIYKGIRTTADDAYFNHIQIQITADGVTPITMHYAYSRLMGDDHRPAKAAYMDVLEYTGIDKRYYNDPQIKKFYCWLFGIAITPNREHPQIGDTGIDHEPGNHLCYWRVGNFDDLAASYAAWYFNGQKPRGHLLTYILMRKPLPPALLPSSGLYPDGGGWFRENMDTITAMHGVLYNIKAKEDWHTHEETNAVTFSALGVRLLVNGGRLGPPVDEAWRQNTLTINGARHSKKRGNGLTEGLTSLGFDYAQGDDGPALADAVHLRSLMMIHGQKEIPGYFAVFDDVTTDSINTIKTYWQIATNSALTPVEANTQYLADINWYPKRKGVKLTTFFATPPTEVNASTQKFGQAPTDYERLEAVYSTSSKGKLHTLTLFFPHDSSTLLPSISRITLAGATAAIIQHGQQKQDVLVAAEESGIFTTHGFTFTGKSAICRTADKENAFYFVGTGTSFLQGNEGFTSDVPVSIHIRGHEGAITSEKTAKLTFRHKGLTKVYLGDTLVNPIQQGTGWQQILLPAGTHNILLQTSKSFNNNK